MHRGVCSQLSQPRSPFSEYCNSATLDTTTGINEVTPSATLQRCNTPLTHPIRPALAAASPFPALDRQGQSAPAGLYGSPGCFTLIDRSIPNIHPFGNPALRADGKAAYDGWPDSPRIEELRRAWLDAGEFSEQRRIAAELQMQVWQDVPFIPMGEYWQTTAYRKGLTGIIPGCFTVFYNVKRA